MSLIDFCAGCGDYHEEGPCPIGNSPSELASAAGSPAEFKRLRKENDKLTDLGIAMALRSGLLDYICEVEEASQREDVPEDVDFLFLAKDHTTFWGKTYMQAAFKAMTYDEKRLKGN